MQIIRIENDIQDAKIDLKNEEELDAFIVSNAEIIKNEQASQFL